MSATAARVDAIDTNWRILQAHHEKRMTPRGRSRCSSDGRIRSRKSEETETHFRRARKPQVFVETKKVLVETRDRRQLQLVREHEIEERDTLLGDPVCWKANLVATVEDPADQEFVRELLDDTLPLRGFTGAIRVGGLEFVFELGKRVAPVEPDESNGADVFFWTTVDPEDFDPEMVAIITGDTADLGTTLASLDTTFSVEDEEGGGCMQVLLERERAAAIAAGLEHPDLDDPEWVYNQAREPLHLPLQ